MIQRTTLRLDPQLLHEAKVRAAQEGITLTALVERSLRESMRPRPRRRPMRLPTAGEGGLMPGIDLDDRATLLQFMCNAGEPARIESPTFDGGDPHPGVNLECNADVLDRMDGTA